jgi:hypothetical protein
MRLKNRVKNVENKLRIGKGVFYLARFRGGVYEITPYVYGVDKFELTKEQFEKWKSSRGEKDCLITVNERGNKLGASGTKENENV